MVVMGTGTAIAVCINGYRREGVRCTVMEKSSAPFSLEGDNLKRYFDQR